MESLWFDGGNRIDGIKKEWFFNIESTDPPLLNGFYVQDTIAARSLADPKGETDNLTRMPSRILVQTELFPPFVCGEGVFASNLAKGLCGLGHQVEVITSSFEGQPVREEVEGIVLHRLRSIPNPLYPTFRLSLPCAQVAQILDNFRPDAIQINNPSLVGSRLLSEAHRREIPNLATNHYLPTTATANNPLLAPLEKWLSRLAYRAMVRFYRRADRVTAPSHFARELLVDQGVGEEIRCLSNGVDTQRFHPRHCVPGYWRQLGIPPDAQVLLHHGRLHRSKRCDLVLDSMRHLPETVWLVVSGDGPARKDLERMAPQRVRFTGPIKHGDLPVHYASANAFVTASPHELQGIVLLEALASGLPVVGADAGAIPELVVPGATGELFLPGSATDCAKKCLRALEHRAGYAPRQMALGHDLADVVSEFERLLLRS